MKFQLLIVLLLGLADPAHTKEEHHADVQEVSKTLDFIADVSKLQGEFDSVVQFCLPHAPQYILKQSQGMWLMANQKYLDLRDKELRRIIKNAEANGAKPDKIASIHDWAKEQYKGTLSSDRMYKDIATRSDLDIACSKRLGEMNSSGMQLNSIAPRAVAYAQHVGWVVKPSVNINR